MTQDNQTEAARRVVPARPAHAPDSLDATESQIAQTRGDMNVTLDAIQAKLNPDTLKDQAKEVMHDAAEQAQELVHDALHDAAEQAKEVIQTASEQARETVREATEQAKDAVHDATIGRAETAVGDIRQSVRGMGTTMLETIKQNPVPAALAGIGLGWLYMKHRESSSQTSSRSNQQTRPARYAVPVSGESWPYAADGASADGTDGVSGMAGRAADQAKSMASGAADKATSMASGAAGQVQAAAGQASDTAGDVAYGALEGAGSAIVAVQQSTASVTSSMAGRMQQMLDESPLALGGLALATGAAIGLLLPSTQSEDDLMGGARDRVFQQAKQTAKEVQPKVEQVVEEAKNAGMQEAQKQTAST